MGEGEEGGEESWENGEERWRELGGEGMEVVEAGDVDEEARRAAGDAVAGAVVDDKAGAGGGGAAKGGGERSVMTLEVHEVRTMQPRASRWKLARSEGRRREPK